MPNLLSAFLFFAFLVPTSIPLRAATEPAPHWPVFDDGRTMPLSRYQHLNREHPSPDQRPLFPVARHGEGSGWATLAEAEAYPLPDKELQAAVAAWHADRPQDVAEFIRHRRPKAWLHAAREHRYHQIPWLLIAATLLVLASILRPPLRLPATCLAALTLLAHIGLGCHLGGRLPCIDLLQVAELSTLALILCTLLFARQNRPPLFVSALLLLALSLLNGFLGPDPLRVLTAFETFTLADQIGRALFALGLGIATTALLSQPRSRLLSCSLALLLLATACATHRLFNLHGLTLEHLLTLPEATTTLLLFATWLGLNPPQSKAAS